jgi:hypothetical protein
LIQPPAGAQGFLSGLEESALAELVGRSAWLYPVVEIVHVVGFVILVGCILVFDLRILGLLRRLPVEDAVAHLTRWARWSLVLVVPSGLVLFMVEATTLAGNPAFRWKLAFMALAAVNAALFHGVTWRRSDGGRHPAWSGDTPLPVPARLASVASMLLWFLVLSAGTFIPYA